MNGPDGTPLNRPGYARRKAARHEYDVTVTVLGANPGPMTLRVVAIHGVAAKAAMRKALQKSGLALREVVDIVIVRANVEAAT